MTTSPRRSKFRPCIDLHKGVVKQIVGGSLSDSEGELRTNFVAEHSSAWFAERYRLDQLQGGHVIKLGPGNDEAAKSALAAYPQGLQIGGGISLHNAEEWLEAGASHIIVTSALFDDQGHFLDKVLHDLETRVGKERLVIDLSCRRRESGWMVAMNRWQQITDMEVSPSTLTELSSHCAEFLIHAADVEGLCQGIDEELLHMLGQWRGCPMTYAGGIRSLEDFDLIDRMSQGSVDATVGSALDIFGGKLICYEELVQARG